jgi:hypothetical protein
VGQHCFGSVNIGILHHDMELAHLQFRAQ